MIPAAKENQISTYSDQKYEVDNDKWMIDSMNMDL